MPYDNLDLVKYFMASIFESEYDGKNVMLMNIALTNIEIKRNKHKYSCVIFFCVFLNVLYYNIENIIKMEVNPMILGRMGYEFSTCSAGSEVLLKKIIQKYGEDGNSGATRYGYEIFVDLKENASTQQFDVKDIYSRFLRQLNNSTLSDILEPESSGGLSAEDKNVILEGLVKTPCSANSRLALFSVADIFKCYLADNKYKSVVLSTIVSYGRNVNMSHQCGIMALGAPHNMFLFYEPYGMYNKYGFNYKDCFGSMFEIIGRMKTFESYKYATYHDYFGVPKGIQNLMLDFGASRQADFDPRYEAIKKKAIEKCGVSSGKWTYENDPLDKTFALCTLMDHAAHCPSILKESAELYYEYSAKTCVTIFLVETAKLMMLLKTHSDKDSISTALTSWYAQYQDKTPSAIMNKLDHLMRLLYDENTKKSIYEVFEDVTKTPSDICEFLISEK